MKKLFATLSALMFMTACGVQEGDDSAVSSVAAPAPNLVATAPNFRCGDALVFVVVKNIGNADAGFNFFRIDQNVAGSNARGVKPLKPGASETTGIGVSYKAGKLTAKIAADSLNDVKESNEHDNILNIVCN